MFFDDYICLRPTSTFTQLQTHTHTQHVHSYARDANDEYLSPPLLLILQPDVQLPHHHLAFPLCYGAAGFIVSGHQGVDVSQDRVDSWYLIQLVQLTVELLLTTTERSRIAPVLKKLKFILLRAT